MSPEIAEIYTNRLRVRVCGLCWQNERLLMVNHRGLTSGSFWSPPGGGIEFGEPAQEALVREFREETGVGIIPKEFRFLCEYIQQPLPSGQARIHAVELFFAVDYLNGEPLKGSDPESDAEHQIITEVKFMSVEQILALPAHECHGVFRLVKSAADLKSLTGFYRI